MRRNFLLAVQLGAYGATRRLWRNSAPMAQLGAYGATGLINASASESRVKSGDEFFSSFR
jgi:hypothetical protein